MALKSKMKFYNIFSFKSFTMNFTIGFQPSIWIFIVSAGLLWIASNKLSKVVNFIDTTFHLGSSFGGTVILSVVTNLPEIAITVNGALKGDTDLAIGNILGGIVIQSVLLVLFDFASRKEKKPLSSLVSNKASIIQGIFLIIILALVILGKQMKESQILYRSTVPELMIVFSWVVSIILLKKIQKGTTDHDSKPAEKPHKPTYTKTSALFWLTGISLVILIFGVLLEVTSDAIASHFHLNGIMFGATVLALVTSLPEISGGLAFVREKNLAADYQRYFRRQFIPSGTVSRGYRHQQRCPAAESRQHRSLSYCSSNHHYCGLYHRHDSAASWPKERSRSRLLGGTRSLSCFRGRTVLYFVTG